MALLTFGILSFSMAQKKYIRERDHNECQFCAPHPCNGSHDMPEEDRRLQVHHVIPQRYAHEFGIDPDFVENGITLCEQSHQELVHPDMKEAKKTYFKDKSSYKRVFDARKDKLKHRQIYWNDQWDRQFHTIIVRNEQRAKREGIVYDAENDHSPRPQKKRYHHGK